MKVYLYYLGAIIGSLLTGEFMIMFVVVMFGSTANAFKAMYSLLFLALAAAIPGTVIMLITLGIKALIKKIRAV